ncbi:MAG: UbiH/UbiF/VisC/COQ6 family ubiquinone biosynthesis hydroxylase [Nevskiales bacterium]|nr:UbiH/UbiF/VisC/COQ6 family ubiquinone biosynthesis hydroxylase [Nevskiales bacterium]
MAKPVCDVVVVGGGVVGTATALALGRQGLDVTLLERSTPPVPSRPELYDFRVYALSPGTVKFLKELGVWESIRAQRVSPYERMEAWEADPASALRFDAAELGVPELGCIVEDSLLRAALWSALGKVTVRCGVKLAGFCHEDGTARLDLQGGDRLRASLIVAAEGGHSRLREWAGLETVGWNYPQRSIVCHVTTEAPHRRAAYQRFLPKGPLAFLPLADGRSSIVWSTDAHEAAELLKLDDDDFRTRLAAAFEHRLGAITAVTARRDFPLRLLHAPEYARPGLVLVGDSAHVVHPMAGQGLNLGLADVQALVQTLTAARTEHRHCGDLRVLRRYERRRKADNLEMLALTDGLYRIYSRHAPGWNRLRKFGMSLAGRLPPLKRRLALRAMGF